MGMAGASSRSTIKNVVLTRTIEAGGNYEAYDVVSNSSSAGTVWTFPEVASSNGGSGRIIGAVDMWETTDITPRLTLYLFHTTPTSNLNDAAPNTAVLHADVAKFIGKIDFAQMGNLGTLGDVISSATPSTVGGIPLTFTCASGVDDIYGIVIINEAETAENAGHELTIVLQVEQW